VQITEFVAIGWLLEGVLAGFISFLGLAIGCGDGLTPNLEESWQSINADALSTQSLVL
jgi:hypothetical protein